MGSKKGAAKANPLDPSQPRAIRWQLPGPLLAFFSAMARAFA